MKKVFFTLVVTLLLILGGCASKAPVREVNVVPTIVECPAPTRPTLKLLKTGHIGSKQGVSVIVENFNLLDLYSSQLENTVDCYEKQVAATKKVLEQQQDSGQEN